MPEEKTEEKGEGNSREGKERAGSGNKQLICALRIRGGVNIKSQVREIMENLRLYKKNTAVVYQDTPSIRGMLFRVKDFITYGYISEEVFRELIEKRGEEYKGRTQDSKGKITYNKFVDLDGKKYKKFFRLNNPKGGFEKKGIKKSYRQGGVLGFRESMDKLLQKMM